MVSGRYDTEGDVLSVTARETEWLSLKDVQRLLGIGRTKTYELVTTGELPAVRIGRCIRVNRPELDEWLRTQRYVDSIRHDIV
jgi:excisionase family DNA binding protein